jgi:UDP-N-acetylglucosamine acyltransferase
MNYPLTFIHPEAKIGENVTIEPFVTIHKDTVIGDGTTIRSNVVIMDGARIGKNVTIFPNAVISAIPQDLKFKGEITTAEIGDNTVIRECVTVNRGTVAKGKTTVGNNCLLMAYVHVAHDCRVGNHVIMANNATLAGEVEVDDWAILGGSTKVHQFTRIGAHVMTQGGLLLGKDAPPFVIAARYIPTYTGVNAVGLKRRGFTSETINHIQDIYRILFSKGLSFPNAVDQITKEIFDSPEKKLILDFLAGSTRGIIQGYKGNEKE